MAETFVVDQYNKPTITKDPNAILDYTFDWTAWLGADNVASIDCAVTDTLTAAISASYFDSKRVTIWVQGGMVNEKVRVRCRIITVGGRTDDRSVFLKIKER
jgi:hypothetical protein